MTNPFPDKLNLFSLSLGDLNFFVTVYESGSLTQAAQITNTSLSTASRTLKKLRETFQDPLFLRSTPRLIPTERTEFLIPKISSIVKNAVDFQEPKAFDPRKMRRTFHIGAVDNAIFAVLPRFIKNFFEEAPNSSIHFATLTTNCFEMLESGQLSGAICPTSIEVPPNFSGLNLYPVSYCVCVRKGHPLEAIYKKKGKITRKNIEKYRKIMISDDIENVQRFYFLDESAYNGKTWQEAAITVPYFLSIPALLNNTDFTVTLPTQTAKQFERDFTGLPISYFPFSEIDAGIPSAPLYHTRFIWHKRSDNDPAIQWLRALLVKYVRTLELDPLQ